MEKKVEAEKIFPRDGGEHAGKFVQKSVILARMSKEGGSKAAVDGGPLDARAIGLKAGTEDGVRVHVC